MALWRHIRRWLLHAQIAKFIFTNEMPTVNIDFPPLGIYGLACKKCKYLQNKHISLRTMVVNQSRVIGLQ